jgi:hypothetical protein
MAIDRDCASKQPKTQNALSFVLPRVLVLDVLHLRQFFFQQLFVVEVGVVAVAGD